jgi:hypothetical protein
LALRRWQQFGELQIVGCDTMPEAEHGRQLGIDPAFEHVAQWSTVELEVDTIGEFRGRIADRNETMLVFPLCERARLKLIDEEFVVDVLRVFGFPDLGDRADFVPDRDERTDLE